MSVIKCPHCGEVFTIDETNYNSIVKQIRDHEFQEEIAQREKLLKKQMETSLQLAENKAKGELEKQRSEQESELSKLRHQNELLKSEYDAKIAQALAEQNAAYEKNLSAANRNVSGLENEIRLLKEKVAHAENDKASAVKETAAVKEKEAADLIAKYTYEITELKGSLSSA